MSISLDQLIRDAISGATERAPKATAPVRRPQVSLLPVEVRDGARSRRLQTALVAAVVAVAVAAGGATALAASRAAEADARGQDATTRLSAASAQLGRFHDLQSLQQRIALERAAVKVGGSTQIDWQRWIGLLLADMPSGYTVQTIAADGATPVAAYEQGTTPLDRPRVATVVITAKTPSITQLPVWLRKLKSLPAYADATPLVTDAEGGYTVQVTVHLTSAAFVTPLKG